MNVRNGRKADIAPERNKRQLEPVEASDGHQEQARRAADRAHRLMSQPATLDSYSWGLVAALLVEADEAFSRAQELNPSITLPLLDAVLEELRDITSDFTKPDFIKATRAARRQRPSLFTSRR